MTSKQERLAAARVAIPVGERRVGRLTPSQKTVFRAAWATAGLFFFVFALQLIKAGARSVVRVLEQLNVEGPANSLGFGWLAAYAALSGSPVAAIGTTLLAGGVLDEREAFAVIGGSRLGASFIVLAVGYVLYLGG